MTTQILQQSLNVIGCNASRAGSISCAYSTTLGVLGGFQYMAISRVTTGIYKAQLRNIYIESPITSTSAGGNTSFNYANNIYGVSARIQYGGLTTTAIGTSGYYNTNVVVDATNSWILVYVYNYSAALADLPSADKLVIDVIIGGLT